MTLPSFEDLRLSLPGDLYALRGFQTRVVIASGEPATAPATSLLALSCRVNTTFGAMQRGELWSAET